jgi:hypothetical protein
MPLQPSNNPAIVYQDDQTGIYKDIDGTWYLKNGTPIDDWDPNTGAYQEGGNWYTFQGVELMSYDKKTGIYQEAGDPTYYTKEGIELDSISKLPIANAVANPKKVLNKKPKSLVGLYIGIGVIAVAFIAIAIALKKK